jgi:hypothetical protein
MLMSCLVRNIAYFREGRGVKDYCVAMGGVMNRIKSKKL